jgi:hypothetical protein
MRLGEIKVRVEAATNNTGQLEIEHEQIFGGQAYRVQNYGALVETLTLVSDASWNDQDFGPIKEIIDEHGKDVASASLSQPAFNQLKSYVNSLNQKFPVFVGVLNDYVEVQDEKAVNIKLPDNIVSLNELSAFNKRLSTIFLQYNVDGQVEFRGFDKGTSWIEVVAIGTLTYQYILAGLTIAKKYFELKKSYYDSETARINYEAAIEKDEVDDEEYEEFSKRALQKMVESEVKKAVSKIGVGSENENETTSKIINATTALIKEIKDDGVEFHLSLNPPKYASEDKTGISIDYSKLPKLKTEKTVKELKDSTDSKEDE